MTRNTLKRLALAATIAVIPIIGHADNFDNANRAYSDCLLAHLIDGNYSSPDEQSVMRLIHQCMPEAAAWFASCRATPGNTEKGCSDKTYLMATTTISATGLAQNTIPFPDFPDPTAACQTLAAQGRPIERLRGNPGFEEVVNQCIAKDQQGYDLAKDDWPALTQKNASFCVDAVSKNEIFKYALLGECAMQMLAAQPLPPQTFNKW
jgi:hypothetical protein